MKLTVKDSVTLEKYERQNIANILMGNFASQVANRVTAIDEKGLNESVVGLKIASEQLGKFIVDLIVENGNLKLA
jgi:hypothetical protein